MPSAYKIVIHLLEVALRQYEHKVPRQRQITTSFAPTMGFSMLGNKSVVVPIP